MPDCSGRTSTSTLVIVLIVFHFSTGGTQNTISPKNTAARLGETIQLECPAPEPGDTVVITVTRVDNNMTFEIGYANENGTFVTKQFAKSHTLRYVPELPAVSTPLPYNVTAPPMDNQTDTNPSNVTDANPSNVTDTPKVTELTQSGVTTLADNVTSRRLAVEITEAHYDNAGAYVCRSQLSNIAYLAEVLILGDIECDDDLKDNQVLLGQTFHMTCRLTFSGSMTPVLQWFNYQGPITDGQRGVIVNSHKFGSVSYSISLSATETVHGNRYTCDATVPVTNITTPAGNTFRLAVNKPDYLIRYNSAPVIVLYAPRVKLIPSRLSYHVGESFTLEATARPPARRLQCLAEKTGKEYQTTLGEVCDAVSSKTVRTTITITNAMLGGETFHCSADNIIDGVKSVTTKRIRINVFTAAKYDPATASIASGAAVLNIGVVVAGLVLLTLV